MYGIEDKRNTYARLRKAFNKGITCQKVAKTSGWEICGHDVYKALTGEILEIEKWKIIDRALTLIEKEAEEKKLKKLRKEAERRIPFSVKQETIRRQEI